MVDADLENNLNYGESFYMLNCNLYLRNIRSTKVPEKLFWPFIVLSFSFKHCFVVFFFPFLLLFTFRPKIGF